MFPHLFNFGNIFISTLSKRSFFNGSFTVSLPDSKRHLEGIVRFCAGHGVSCWLSLAGRSQTRKLSLTTICWQVTSRCCYSCVLNIAPVCRFILVYCINIGTRPFSGRFSKSITKDISFSRFFQSKGQRSSFTRLFWWFNCRAVEVDSWRQPTRFPGQGRGNWLQVGTKHWVLRLLHLSSAAHDLRWQMAIVQRNYLCRHFQLYYVFFTSELQWIPCWLK